MSRRGNSRPSELFGKAAMEIALTGRYVTKAEALELLRGMNVVWSQRQIDWTAEPDATGQRKWPWFLDVKGVLRIDEGFIRAQFAQRQIKALQEWNP
tara:strand:+ start:31428 stop:31718 length:291 start_codon:yes stop_codon:yes gene_type:complete